MRKINKDSSVSIIDMVLYLENSVFKLKKIISILDEVTLHVLKTELANKHKIKIDKNILYKLLK